MSTSDIVTALMNSMAAPLDGQQGDGANSQPSLPRAIAESFKPHLEKTLARISTIKTFLKPNEAVPLKTSFVSASIKDGEKHINEEGLIHQIERVKRIVVSALAGRGKSVLMRYVALSYYHTSRHRLPLFLELRALNGLSSKNILGYLHSTYRGATNVSFPVFLEALRNGHFILLLDGFDEVDYDSRHEVEAQILRIASDFVECPIVISSRPEERFRSWDKFKVVDIAPMSLVQVKELIQKAEYDSEVTKAFLKRLTDEFYQEHSSFLGTPLLAILLMLTFEQYAEIPRGMHTFYHNAFETLVRRHDAMKSQFLRKTYSRCSADDFRRIFAAFSMYTYARDEFQFTRQEIIDAFALAAKKQGIPAKPADLLADYVESICLIQVEGLEYSFVHRSFQEYFTALFIANSAAGVLERYLDSGRARVHDNVLPMLFEMAKDRIESEWVRAFVTNLLADLSRDKDPPLKLLMDAHGVVYIGIYYTKAHFVHFLHESLGRKIATLRRFYKAYFIGSSVRPDYPDQVKNEQYAKRLTDLVHRKHEAGDRRFAQLPSIIEKYERGDYNHVSTLKIRLFRKDRDWLVELDLYQYGEGIIQALTEIKRDVDERLDADRDFLEEVFQDA